MKYAAIVPIPMLKFTQDYGYHMVLSQLCETEEEYGLFYHHVGGWKILDNGAAEGKTLSPESLTGWANILKADEIIAPDVLHENQASIDLLADFMKHVGGEHRVMAVMQATNWVEFNRIMDVALSLDVYSLALPKLLTKHFGPSVRLAAAETIRKHTDKPIHCLGCSARFHEVKDLVHQGIVRGIDSSAPVVLGLKGLSLKRTPKYDWETSHRAVLDYWHQHPTKEVLQNLDRFNGWCAGQTSSPASEL